MMNDGWMKKGRVMENGGYIIMITSPYNRKKVMWTTASQASSLSISQTKEDRRGKERREQLDIDNAAIIFEMSIS
jgi:hypothetical protein